MSDDWHHVCARDFDLTLGEVTPLRADYCYLLCCFRTSSDYNTSKSVTTNFRRAMPDRPKALVNPSEKANPNDLPSPIRRFSIY